MLTRNFTSRINLECCKNYSIYNAQYNYVQNLEIRNRTLKHWGLKKNRTSHVLLSIHIDENLFCSK